MEYYQIKNKMAETIDILVNILKYGRWLKKVHVPSCFGFVPDGWLTDEEMKTIRATIQILRSQMKREDRA